MTEDPRRITVRIGGPAEATYPGDPDAGSWWVEVEHPVFTEPDDEVADAYSMAEAYGWRRWAAGLLARLGLGLIECKRAGRLPEQATWWQPGMDDPTRLGEPLILTIDGIANRRRARAVADQVRAMLAALIEADAAMPTEEQEARWRRPASEPSDQAGLA